MGKLVYLLGLIALQSIALISAKYHARPIVPNMQHLFNKRDSPIVPPISYTYVTLHFGMFEKSAYPTVNNDGGWPEGYLVNGQPQPQLTFATEITYRFNTTAVGISHPIYISTDLGGNNLYEWTEGVSPPSPAIPYLDYLNAAAGKELWWTPVTTTAQLGTGRDFYYQCRNHLKMGYTIKVVPIPVCTRWSIAQTLSGSDIIAPALDDAFSKWMDVPLASYVGTSYPNVNFSANATALNKLKAGYLSFLGDQVLQCASDPSIAPWNFTARGNLLTIHQNIPIGDYEWKTWHDQFQQTDLGANQDYPFEPNKKELKVWLAPWMPQVCNQNCKTSLCDVWSNINYPDLTTWGYENNGENLAWLTAVVSDMVSQINNTLNASSALYNVFQQKGILNNATAFIAGMVRYLGRANVLGCTNTGFPQYTGKTMLAAHANLSIGRNLFAEHNSILLKAFDNQRVHAIDLDRIEALILQDQASICTGIDCDTNVEEVFVFNTKTKTSAHPWYNMGYPEGYVVDEAEGPTLNLTIGKTYVFHNNAPCVHPVYLSYSALGPIGSNLSIVTTGVVSPGIESVCNGGEFTFTPQASQRGLNIYYQCTIHIQMGGRIQICDNVINNTCINNTPAPTPAPTTSPQVSKTINSSANGLLFSQLLFLLSFVVSLMLL